jgi:hypothetical protein
MENIKIRCKECNRELEAHPSQTKTCGCPNMATIKGDTISALDLSKVIMLNSLSEKPKTSVLTNQDIAWHESRRNRKIRKLDFEVR